MTPAEKQQGARASVLRKRSTRATSVYSMKWSRRITWITIPRLCPAWRPGMDQLLDVTAYRHSPHEFSDVKSSQPFALLRHNPARRGRRDCDIAAPVARIGRITGNGVHHAITASVFPR